MSEELIYINGSYLRPNSVKKEVSKAVKELVGLAPEEFDTMLELAEAVLENTKAILDNAEALQNVKIEAEAPLEFKDGEVKLNCEYYYQNGEIYYTGLHVENNHLHLDKASTNSIGGVIIGTGYNDNKGGIECTDEGKIGLLPPGVIEYGYNFNNMHKNNLGGIRTPKIHNTTPSIATVSAGSYYQIETDVYGNAFVRIPETPESSGSGSGSVDTATIDKAGIVKLGTGTIYGKTVPVSTGMDGRLALAIGPNLYDDVGVLNIKIADGLTPGVIKLGTGDTITSGNGSNYGLQYSYSRGAYVTVPTINADVATSTEPGIIKLFTDDYANASNADFIGIGANSNGLLVFKIGTGLQELANGAVSLKLNERYFKHDNDLFTLNIDNIKTDLGL